jgi:hypothetical protein
MSAARILSIGPVHEEATPPSAPVPVAPPRLARAVVVSVSDARSATVALPDGSVTTAAFAMAFPYEASAGDELLVIRDERETFVLGVLSGTGKTSLRIPGNVSLHAAGGELELAGDEGVRIRGPVVEVHADKLHTVARSVVETFTSFFQRVSEVLHVHARQQVSISDEGAYTQAKTASIQTEDTVTINGKEIHLG